MFISSCLVCLLGAIPGLAQEPAPKQAPSSGSLPAILKSLLGAKTEIDGSHIRVIGQGQIELGAGITLFADEIELFLNTSSLVANGNVVFANPDGRIAAERVEFDIEKGTGTFHQSSGIVSLGQTADRAQFGNQDPDVYFYGEKIEKLESRRYRITRGGFTTCVQPTPRWEVTSRSVVLNLDDYAFARNTVLKVKGVPVLYLPAIYYPIQDDDRATGFLMPTYGNSTFRGQSISNAFFWAMGRSQDATFFHDWFTRSGQGVGTEYRYVAGGQSFGNVRLYGFSRKETAFTNGGVVSVLPPEDSLQATVNINQGFGRILRARAFVDYFTDILTQQLYQQNVNRATNAQRAIEGSLSGVLGITSANLFFQQRENFSSANSSVIYGSTPRASVNVAPHMLFGMPLYGSVNTEYVHVLQQETSRGVVTIDRSLDTWDLAPTLQLPLSKLTYLSINTGASYRTTYYSRSLDDTRNLVPGSLLRQFLSVRSEFIGPVLTKIWDTPGSLSTERMKHVIEPTLSADYTTEFANQTRIPNTNNLSDTVIGGATRLTYGLNNRLFYRSRVTGETPGRGITREFLTIGLQQTYYSNGQSFLVDSAYVNKPRAVNLSPVALTARFSPAQVVDANARLEYDVSGKNGLQTFSAGGSVNGANASAFMNYSRQRSTPLSSVSSYLSGSTSLRTRQGRVGGTYGLSWDIGRSYLVSQNIIASYMAQCCGFQVEAQYFNYPKETGIPISSDRRINFSFVLAGLGSFSNFFGAFGGNQPVR